MPLALSDEDFKKFRDLIYDASGIHFSNVNRPILESRLKERIKVANSKSITDYYKHISNDEEELKVLLDSVTTNLTRFFRNASHFGAFENGVVNQLKEIKKREKVIKLWSAGCSTGEEPYSLAMVLRDKLDDDWKIEIIASDISFNVLMKAREGFYPNNRVSGIPEKYLAKYMIKVGDGYQVTDEIKSLIRFDYHNLKHDSGLLNFDVVFCRNVIIYFDGKAQQSVINKMYTAMNRVSFLFIGHSESLFGMNTKFVFSKIDNACLYMKDERKANVK